MVQSVVGGGEEIQLRGGRPGAESETGSLQ